MRVTETRDKSTGSASDRTGGGGGVTISTNGASDRTGGGGREGYQYLQTGENNYIKNEVE